MKAIFSIFLMVALSGLALSGQAPEKRFVGNCSFSGFALLSDSTYRGDIVNFTDRFGDGYNLNQLAAGYEILDGRGLVFEVDTIHSATNFTADVSVTAKVDRGFAPFGSGQAYSPTENGLIPPSSQEQAGLSPTQKARVDRHNVVVMQSLIGGRDSVYSIASVPDTSGLSPVLGDAFVNATADTLGLYDGAGWVLFFGGSQSADGFTILGDGTGGDPFRVNTDSLHTKMVSMDGPLIHYLNPCEANIDLSLSGTLFYDSIRIGDNLSGLITEDDEVPFVVVGITEWPGYATFTLFASNVVPGVYFPGIYYAGELLWSDQVTVVAGSTDTVTVFDPPGQDSILVTRVCGTEISRDTIPLADVLPSDNVTGTGTTNRIPLWAGVQELGDSYLLQSADALTLDASKVFQFAGHTTAGRPTATLGFSGYNTTTNWFEGSNGTSWWYFPRTSLAGGIGTPGSVLLVGSDGSITEDNPNLFWNDPDNFLGIGTAAPASRLHIEGGTLSSANAVGFQHNATLDNVASFSYGQFHTYTSRSGANNLQGGLRVQLNAGYTGNSTTSAVSFLNSAASTGTNLRLGAGNVFPTGNAGVTGSADATTTGNNYGVAGEAMRGNINIGVYGRSSFAKNDASNIGVLGNARNTGTGTARYIGGFFGLITSTPTWESAALIADNGANADPIFLGMDNGSKVFSIVDGGNVGIGAAAAAPTARMHLPAGTTAASTSSLKINEGVNETTPVDGAINHVADRLNFTSGSTVNVLAHLSDITDDQTASEVNITDAGGFYTGTTVEAALQEVGGSPGANLATDDVPRWDGSAFQPSGITSEEDVGVGIVGAEHVRLTSGTARLFLDGNNGIAGLGDVLDTDNGTKITIDDGAGEINMYGPEGIFIAADDQDIVLGDVLQNGFGTVLWIDPGNGGLSVQPWVGSGVSDPSFSLSGIYDGSTGGNAYFRNMSVSMSGLGQVGETGSNVPYYIGFSSIGSPALEKVRTSNSYAAFFEEGVRQYALFPTADTITIDTFDFAQRHDAAIDIMVDSIGLSTGGIIVNQKSEAAYWKVDYGFFVDSDQNQIYTFWDVTTDGSEDPESLDGSASRSEISAVAGINHAGRSFIVRVPSGEGIRLCAYGNPGVTASMDISFLSITVTQVTAP